MTTRVGVRLGRSRLERRLDRAVLVKRARRQAAPKIWVPPLVYVAIALGLGVLAPVVSANASWLPVSMISSPSALALLTAVATGMLAFTGVVLSLALVALQFGATIYGPWLMRARGGTQLLAHALGVFTGTFLYTVLAIPVVDLAGTEGVSAVVVWVSFGWLLGSIVMLLRLVPVIQGMSIDTVLGDLGRQGREAISAVYEPGGDGAGAAATAADAPPAQVIRHAGRPAYLLAVNEAALVELGRARQAVLRIPRAVGESVLSGEPLVTIEGGDGLVPEDRARRAIVVGTGPILVGDPAYALRLLVDIAIRALSPAVNDPTSAAHALDQIEALLRRLAESRLEPGEVRDRDGTLRLVFAVRSWDDLLGLALTEIDYYGRDSTHVQARLDELLQALVEAVPEARRPAVRRFMADRSKEGAG